MRPNRDARMRRIWNIVSAIPEGRVASYGQIAELAGIKRGARLVGWALRMAPDDIELPWHRVLNAQGRIALPRNRAAYAEQIRRLEAESVAIIDDRVDLTRHLWRPELDELLWGPANWSSEAEGAAAGQHSRRARRS